MTASDGKSGKDGGEVVVYCLSRRWSSYFGGNEFGDLSFFKFFLGKRSVFRGNLAGQIKIHMFLHFLGYFESTSSYFGFYGGGEGG